MRWYDFGGIPLSGRTKGNAVHEVVMVAGGIGDQFCRLRLANLVRGAPLRCACPALWREARAESAKDEAADVLPERCRHPSLAVVRRNLHGSNAVGQCHWQGQGQGQGCPPSRMHHSRNWWSAIHHHLGDWRADYRKRHIDFCVCNLTHAARSVRLRAGHRQPPLSHSIGQALPCRGLAICRADGVLRWMA